MQPNTPSSSNDETSLTVLPGQDAAVAAFVGEQIQLAQQWQEYANANRGNPEIVAEAMSALEVIHNELAQHNVLTQSIVAGLQGLTAELTDQRDTAVYKFERLTEEVEDIRSQAFEDGIEAGEENAISMSYTDETDVNPDLEDDIVTASNEAFIEEAEYIAAKLREAGKADEADALETLARTAMQNREQAEDELAQAREMVYRINWQGVTNLTTPPLFAQTLEEEDAEEGES